jgi:glycosyltransferase involved in cell wall biosynthesis
LRHESFLIRRVIAAWGWAQGALRVIRYRREGELDVVYFYFWSPRPTIRRFAFLALLNALRIPVIEELNECPWPVRDGATAWDRLCPRLLGTRGVLSISAFITAWARREGRRVRRDYRVIEVPILVDFLEQAEPAPYPAGPPLVVFAGSPVYDQAIRFVVAAMEEVWPEFPDCRLVVTGAHSEDPQSQWLLAESGSWAPSGGVDIVGYLDRVELLRLYGEARALLIPLFDDTHSRARFPTKIGEYLCSGRPIVTSSVGEIPRFLHDGVDGVLCDPGDSSAYGRAILALLRDPRRADAIGRAGREVARTRLHYSLHAGRLLEGFASVINRGPGPRGVRGGVANEQGRLAE